MKKVFTFFYLFLAFNAMVFAQDLEKVEMGQIALSIDADLKAGLNFLQVDLVSTTNFDHAQEAQKLALELTTLNFIQSEKPSRIKFNLSLAELGSINVILQTSEIWSPGFQVKDGLGNILKGQDPNGMHYKGIVEGDELSTVALSVYADRVSGFIKKDGTIWLIRNFSNDIKEIESHIFKYEGSQTDFWSCQTPDDGYVYTQAEISPSLTTRGPGDPVEIYVEVDNDIYKDKRSGTTNYITGLFNESATLYSNDGITIVLSEMKIWTTRSPYKGNGASQLLSGFQKEHGSAGAWNGDLAHLVAYRGSGGIAAGFNGLCNSDRRQSMCFSGIDASYNTVPTYSWSVMVFTHEMGHLLGSRHTHACVWNGNGTAIDGCYNVEGNCPRPGIPSGGGTIMSYCHLTNAGINFNNGFGSQPKNVILNSIAAAACLGGGNGNHCTNGVQDADEEGVDCGGADCAPCPPPNGCDVPTNLFANNIKGNRVRLNWDAQTGAISYDAQIRVAGGNWTASNTFNTTTNSINIRGLARNTTYEWRVKTNCSGSSSAYSSVCEFVSGDASSGACGGNLVNSIKEISIYPNPASHEITLTGVSSENVTSVEIFNMSGQSVVSQNGVTQNSTINVSTIERGLYFIKIQTTEFSKTLKFQLH